MLEAAIAGDTVADVLLPSETFAEHYMAMPAQPAKRWSADEARRLNEQTPTWWPRYEVIDGELLVSPSPRIAHQIAVGEIAFLLKSFFDGRRTVDVLTAPADITLETDTTVSPDIFVCSRVAGRHVKHWSAVESLLLVVEVLSPSTAQNDRVKKRDYFMRNNVGEYWIVDLDARLVERWRHGDTRPEIVSERLEWRHEDSRESFVLDLPTFFASVSDDES